MKYKHFKLFMVKEEVKDFLSTYLPIPFIYAMKTKYKLNGERDRTVTEETDLVLEGYPRSANSFMSKLFDENTNLLLSDHTHYSSNAILGVKSNKPTIVLIRKPEDAIMSFVSLYLQSPVRDYGYKLEDIKESDISKFIKYSIKRYIRYYSKLERYNSILFLTFKDVTNNLDLVISQINKNCDLNEVVKLKEKASKEVLKDKKAYHLGPSKERDMIKDKVKSIYLNSSKDILDANRVYEKIYKRSKLTN